MVDCDLPQPPIGGLMELAMQPKVEPGRVVFTCAPDESAYNPIGAIHGGTVSARCSYSVTACRDPTGNACR